MSFLKLYTSSQLECQKDGYKNKPEYTILQVDGDYIPTWDYVLTQGAAERMYIQELNLNQLYNGNISVVSETSLGSYVVSYGNGRYYGDKTVQTLTGIYRLKLDVDGTFYYSDLFKNLNSDIPVYGLESDEGELIIYSY